MTLVVGKMRNNMSKDVKGEYCEVCNEFVEGFEYLMCCDGRECGCMGQPIEPCICSTECWEKFNKWVKNRKEGNPNDDIYIK